MRKLLYTITIFLLASQINAQKKDAAPDKTELDNYRYQSERLIEYFSETLNFLGDSTTVAKERQIIVNESYLKIFKDAEIQIEDDLIEDRMVPVYKDTRAYLRDIGFFYKHVHFDYNIQSIEHFYNSRQEINFRVTVNRHLVGKTIKNEVVENNMIRYIEIDLDHAQEILKIVSIYSTRLEEKEDIEIWWTQLPHYWKSYFAKDIPLEDGIQLSDVVSFNDSIVTFPFTQEMAAKLSDTNFILVDSTYNKLKIVSNVTYFAPFMNTNDYTIALPRRIYVKYIKASLHSIVGNMMKQISVDISNQTIYKDLSPLAKMIYLKELNLSGTPINDILDLRNLNNLEKVNISNTNISDISPLQYLINIKNIDFSNTKVSNISSLAYNIALEEIKMNNTPVSDILSLAHLLELKRLWMNNTAISDISALANNMNMEIISFHSTNVSSCDILKNYPNLIMAGMNDTKVDNISALNGLSKLQNIFINNTTVSDISKLDNLESLTRIYCDGSRISKEDAVEYMNLHPSTLVVFESDKLQKWWNSQSEEWKQIWKEINNTKSNPDNDLLHEMVIKKELDLRFSNLSSIDCLSEMLMLEKLNISGNNISSLSPISASTSLKYINFSKTKVNDISPILNNLSLNTIIANETPVANFETLTTLKNLELLECDQCTIPDYVVDKIVTQNSHCLVIYRTVQNKIWWDNLSNAWKEEFFSESSTPDKYDLQRIINSQIVDVRNNRSINNLECLQPFRYINKLIISGTGLSTIDEISDKTSLTYLDFSNNPIENIDKLAGLANIDTLLMENTQIKKIDIVNNFLHLKHINISGTQIKSLKPLATSYNLVSIDFNNTAISNISPLLELSNLQQIKSYRTKVSPGKIEDFKLRNPSCDVIYY